MDVQEILEWTDRLVLAKTGKHLNCLQQAVLTGVWQSRKYKEIAEDYHCSEANVKKVAKGLWYLLSEELGEKVSKSNFRATMERYYVSNFSNIGNVVKSNFVRSHINLCGEGFHSAEAAKKPSTANPDKVKPKKLRDLTDAPATRDLYNRTQELTDLKKWILEENSAIVTIAGMPGIGKTALARQLVEQIEDKFNNILWRSHRQFRTLANLQTNLIEFLSPEQPPTSRSIIENLRSRPTLIILDDLQETFTSGKLAGTYRPDYQNYARFLKQIAESPHNSCLVLLSRETPREIATLEIERHRCRSLQLRGLGESAREILTHRGLTDENRWNELIHLYSGNPSWLKIVAATIQELFNGSAGHLLSSPTVFLGDLEPILEESYQRLSESEKIAIAYLANQPAPVEVARKPTNFPFSQSAYWKAVQSLGRRCLVEKVTAEGVSRFALGAAMGEFVRERGSQ